MKSEYRFLAFDCGATSGRAILGTFSCGSFKTEEVYRFPNSPVNQGGKLFWDVNAMYDHFVQCLTKLGRDGIRLDSIGIDPWGVDFGCISADGRLLALPRAYRDPYTQGVPEEVFKIIPREELYSVTGIQIMDFNTIFQLYAQTKAADAALADAAAILFMPDLMAWMLTGRAVCEYTDASTSGMMDQAARQFNKELLGRLGIRTDVLLPIVQPGTVIGPLKADLAASTGLGPVPVVAVAGHDTASAIAAVPAPDGHFAYLSSGTWSLMGIELPYPIMNAASAAANFTNEGGIDGTTRFLKNITGMWILEQCRTQWKAAGRDYTYPELVQMALSEASFEGRINPDDSRFSAPDNMLEEVLRSARDGQAVILNEVKNLSDAQVVSCIYHSLADRYREVLDLLKGFAPFPIERLHIIGGGSANDLLNQWTADAIGIPVVAGPTEATAIGNLMLQARTAGLAGSLKEMRGMIAGTFKVKEFKPNNK